MGSTYETDSIEKRDEIGLALQAAILVKSAGNLVGCRSWLVARLTLKELRQRVDELAKTIEAGSK
jgi:hypothetical protein